uniref:Mitochondrial genome maintenance exonuclease 1 n=1 Tax=Platynereis dumerilii TaxID=6359 RepID=Q2WBW2_PLADU|nr:hypothetical protein [Platynereis dumerilii]
MTWPKRPIRYPNATGSDDTMLPCSSCERALGPWIPLQELYGHISSSISISSIPWPASVGSTSLGKAPHQKHHSAESCLGLVVKDECNCCPVCHESLTTDNPVEDLNFTSSKNESGCASVKCPRMQICMHNIQGLPLCRCPSVYHCRQYNRKPLCGRDGNTYKNRCYLQMTECSQGKKIRVAYMKNLSKSLLLNLIMNAFYSPFAIFRFLQDHPIRAMIGRNPFSLSASYFALLENQIAQSRRTRQCCLRLIHCTTGKNAKFKGISVADIRKKKQADAVIKWNTECSQIFGSTITKSYNKKRDTDHWNSVRKSKKKNEEKLALSDKPVFSEPAIMENAGYVSDMPLTYSQELGKLIATTDLQVESMKLPVQTKGLHGLSKSDDANDTEIIGPLPLKPEDKQTLDSLIMFPMFERQNSRTALKAKPLTDIDNFKKNFSGAYPSVTTILNTTRPPEAQFFLDRWKQNMIKELGEEGFLKFQQEQLDAGNKFHQAIEMYLDGKEDLELREAVKGNWDSVQPVLQDIGDVKVQEGKVKHPELHYCGILDCLAEYRGNICVMEWKMSKKPKPTLSNTFDYPLQVAAYIGALNFDDRYADKVKNGLIVISYNNGTRADAHLMSVQQCGYYWGQWLRRLHTYWDKVLRGLALPPKSYS